MSEKETNEKDFEFEFFNELENLGDLEEKLINEADTRLRKLAKGHTDIIGAAVALESLDKDAETNYIVRARVVAYVRPENIVAVEKGENPLSALKNALSAIERQVREKRKKLRETWKRPGAAEGNPADPGITDIDSDDSL
jgi:ribosome-associated translation inhibitor RaiA